MTEQTTKAKRDGGGIQFPFTEGIEKKIIALLILGGDRVKKMVKVMRNTDFDNPILQDISKLIIDYTLKYGEPISSDALAEEVKTFLSNNKQLPETLYYDMLEQILDHAESMEREKDEDFVYQKLLAFCAYARMRAALFNSVDLLEKYEYEKIVNEVSQALYGMASSEGLEVLDLMDVNERSEVEWLWFGRIPKGRLTMLVGDPGVGKSYFTMMLAAPVSSGKPWPELAGDPTREVEKGRVILMSAEDDPEEDIAPRLSAHGYDPSMVKIIAGKKDQTAFSLVKDIGALEGLLEELGDVKLLIIDSIDSYIPANVYTNMDANLRANILIPLVNLAKRRNVTIIAVKHLNKKEELSAIYRVSGSVAYTGVARSVWLIAEKPRPEGYLGPMVRLFKCLKMNCAERAGKDLEYIVEDRQIKILGRDFSTLDRALRKKEDEREKPGKIAEAFLIEFLKDGRKHADEVASAAADLGIKSDTLGRAGRSLKVEHNRDKDGWYWSLPVGEY